MTLKNAIQKRFSRRELRSVILIVISVTVIISIFDYDEDKQIWITEIFRNLVLSLCLAFTFLVYSVIIDVINLKNRWLYYFVKVILWTLSGITGALLGWFVNDLLFGFWVSHIFLFFAVISSISFVISVILTGHGAMRDQIQIMADRISKNTIREQKLLKLQADAKLEALRSKINPHFFFNTLNTIAELIPTDPKQAEHLIEQFSSLFRYPFSEENNELVPLKKEIDFIKDYLEIEKSRLGERLTFSVNCDENVEDFQIPAMLIQPITENSIIHGVSPKKEGGHIKINCRKENKYCIIEIIDNGKGLDLPSLKKGFGISSVEERLALLYNNDFGFDIISETGVHITLKIPERTT
jgi:two-component system LytT family sensor kinase